MKTVIVDKDNLCVGFGEPVADPVATKLIIQPILEGCQEAQDVAAKVNEINAIKKLANDALGASRNMQQGTARDLKYAEYLNYYDQAKQKEVFELKPLVEKLHAKRVALHVPANLVYFEPKNGEHIITQAEYDALVVLEEQLTVNKALQFDPQTKTGALIDDYRGVTHWTDDAGVWSKGVITQVGVALPVGSIPEADLTEAQKLAIGEQLEAERVAGLSAADKLAEKETAIATATAQSVSLRSQYEIEGRTDPLGDAQAWLAEQVTIIEAKYA